MRNVLKSALARLVRLALAFPPIFSTVKAFLRDNPEALYRIVEGRRFAQSLASQTHLLKGIVSTDAFWKRFVRDDEFQNGLTAALAALPEEEQSKIALRILQGEGDIWAGNASIRDKILHTEASLETFVDNLKTSDRLASRFADTHARRDRASHAKLLGILLDSNMSDVAGHEATWLSVLQHPRHGRQLRQAIGQADARMVGLVISDALQPLAGTHHRARAVSALAMALASEAEASSAAALHHAFLSWEGLTNHLGHDWQPNLDLFGHLGTARPRDFTTILSALVGAIADGQTIKLKGGMLEFQDAVAFAETSDEILAKEQYYFQTTAEKPYVLDCGVNAGLAIYYVKQLYPGARVVGFEPHPPTADLARRNVERLGYRDVVIHTQAIAATEGELAFAVSDNPLGHHLASAAEQAEAGGQILTVPAVPLSPFVNEPVDFLKLDIEGAEFDVLHELGLERLKLIRNMFIEYHIDGATDWDRLAIVIALLRQAEFDLMVEGASWAQRSRARRPLATVGKHVSLSIYAKRRTAS